MTTGNPTLPLNSLPQLRSSFGRVTLLLRASRSPRTEATLPLLARSPLLGLESSLLGISTAQATADHHLATATDLPARQVRAILDCLGSARQTRFPRCQATLRAPALPAQMLRHSACLSDQLPLVALFLLPRLERRRPTSSEGRTEDKRPLGCRRTRAMAYRAPQTE